MGKGVSWDKLAIGDVIQIDLDKMTVNDICKKCRRVWAESKDEFFYLKVNRELNYEIINRKSK